MGNQLEIDSLRSLRDRVNRDLRRIIIVDAQRLAAYELVSNALAHAYRTGRADERAKGQGRLALSGAQNGASGARRGRT